MSLPVRECGLKQLNRADFPCFQESLPVRECGLKQLVVVREAVLAGHSPCGSVD